MKRIGIRYAKGEQAGQLTGGHVSRYLVSGGVHGLDVFNELERAINRARYPAFDLKHHAGHLPRAITDQPGGGSWGAGLVLGGGADSHETEIETLAEILEVERRILALLEQGGSSDTDHPAQINESDSGDGDATAPSHPAEAGRRGGRRRRFRDDSAEDMYWLTPEGIRARMEADPSGHWAQSEDTAQNGGGNYPATSGAGMDMKGSGSVAAMEGTTGVRQMTEAVLALRAALSTALAASATNLAETAATVADFGRAVVALAQDVQRLKQMISQVDGQSRRAGYPTPP